MVPPGAEYLSRISGVKAAVIGARNDDAALRAA
jgi:hypothetical protein